VRIAALADMHYARPPEPAVREVLTQAGRESDVVLICRDLTDHGLPEDAVALAREIHASVSATVNAGLGNHAFEGGTPEEIIKQFVREAVDEALKLESALARLRGRPRIAVLHYSPIQETVEGEPVEIFPFLGSSRLEEPLTRYPVQAVFHGHAHRGQPEGKTAQGVPVFNVSLSLLRHAYPDRPPFRVFEVAVGESS